MCVSRRHVMWLNRSSSLKQSGIARLLLSLFLFGLPAIAVADDLDPEETNLIDDVHERVSTGFSDLIGSFDNFFSNAEDSRQLNRSWMRLRVETSKFESDDIKGRINAKLKLVLPNTEQRVRLLVSTEEEDTRDPDAQTSSDQAIANADNDGNLSLALRFLQSVRDTNSLQFDVGARIRDGKAQAFGRINAFKEVSPWPDSRINLTNNLWYFSSSGYENNLRLAYEKPLDQWQDALFLSSTQLSVKEGRKGAVIGQSLGLYKNWNERTFTALELLGSVRTADSVSAPEHFRAAQIRLRLRQNIFRPWFYYEIWPRVRWPAENGYRGVFGVLARVEVVVGRRKDN